MSDHDARALAAEAALERLLPLMPRIGVSRLANITGLDRLGIPVVSAIRPAGLLLQTSGGRGRRPTEAHVSALMEAIEHMHIESPPAARLRSSHAALMRAGQAAIAPGALPLFMRDRYWDAGYVLDWLAAEDLRTGATVLVPAGAVCARCVPALYILSSNGVSAGATCADATLHALYELIERDAVSRLSVGGRLRLSAESCRFINPATVDNPIVAELYERTAAAGVRLVLIRVRGCTPIHTFWAALLERDGLSHTSLVHFGYGAHLHAGLAAVRAITEAAQSRLTFIQGVREDFAAKIEAKHSGGRHRRVYEVFDGIAARDDWRALPSEESAGTERDIERTLGWLAGAGRGPFLRVNLTRPDLDIPVVRVLAPGMAMHTGFF
jgi:ribosomal protein S12 methylthiotransferase accessory factor